MPTPLCDPQARRVHPAKDRADVAPTHNCCLSDVHSVELDDPRRAASTPASNETGQSAFSGYTLTATGLMKSALNAMGNAGTGSA